MEVNLNLLKFGLFILLYLLIIRIIFFKILLYLLYKLSINNDK